MPADRDRPLEKTTSAVCLSAMVQQERTEVQTAAAPAVAAVVLSAGSELFEDTAMAP
jgi:hypothetical protein